MHRDEEVEKGELAAQFKAVKGGSNRKSLIICFVLAVVITVVVVVCALEVGKGQGVTLG